MVILILFIYYIFFYGVPLPLYLYRGTPDGGHHNQFSRSIPTPVKKHIKPKHLELPMAFYPPIGSS